MISNSSVTIHDWDLRTEVLAVEKLLCIKAGWDLQLWHETSHQPATTDLSSSGWHLKYPTDVIWIPNSTYLSLSVLDELIALHDLKCHLSSIQIIIAFLFSWHLLSLPFKLRHFPSISFHFRMAAFCHCDSEASQRSLEMVATVGGLGRGLRRLSLAFLCFPDTWEGQNGNIWTFETFGMQKIVPCHTAIACYALLTRSVHASPFMTWDRARWPCL